MSPPSPSDIDPIESLHDRSRLAGLKWRDPYAEGHEMVKGKKKETNSGDKPTSMGAAGVAAAGAAAGSLLGPLGAVVGAVVVGLVGANAGKAAKAKAKPREGQPGPAER